MRSRYKWVAGAGALLAGVATMLVGGASSASAAAENVTWCNTIGGTTIGAIFPQRGSFSTFGINAGSCLEYDGVFSAGEPYIIRIYNGGAYRDLAGYTIWGCNERVEVDGSYDNPSVAQACV